MFETLELAPKQKEVLKLWANNKLKWLNIFDGSVRSGKTIISLILWVLWISEQDKNGLYLMAGNTLTTLKNNILLPLTNIVSEKFFEFSIPAKRGILLGRNIHLEGASDSRSSSKIRGMTLDGLYLDEITLLNEDFFKTAYERLSKENSIMIGTTNPDSPDHWLMKDYINRRDNLSLSYTTFKLEDNTFLPPHYVENLKRTHTGVFYDRYVLGKWVRAEGIIYQLIADNKDKYIIDYNTFIDEALKNIYRINVGVDFGGNRSKTSFVATAYTQNNLFYVLKSYTFKSNNDNPQTLTNKFIDFVTEIYNTYNKTIFVYCDSAESVLIKGLRNAVQTRLNIPITVKNAKKRPIIERIRFTNSLLSKDTIKFLKNYTDSLIDALLSAVWEEKGNIDKRKDDNTSDIDTLDAFEYSIESLIKFI